MACWSAENATKAYLTTLNMVQRGKEPDVAEFISALAAGNNAQLMVAACAGAADSTPLLALVAAAIQTGGRVVCIVRGVEDLTASKNLLGEAALEVEFVVGEARDLLASNRFEAANFVVIDCNLENHEEIFEAVQVNENRKQKGRVVVGYNALSCKGCLWNCGWNTQLLPIGEGLRVTRFGFKGFGGNNNHSPRNGYGVGKNRSRWVVKIDKCTGEEHVFRVRVPLGRVIQA